MPKQKIVVYVFVAALVLLGCVAYFTQGWRTVAIGEEQSFFWDAVIKAAGGVAALGGAWLAFSKYLHEKTLAEKAALKANQDALEEKARANQAALIEAQKPFSAKRQEVYYDLVSTTSTIANRGHDDPIRTAAEEKFWWLFWGGVPMVADKQVGVAVDTFMLVLVNKPHNGEELRNKSMDLARACRRSLGFVEDFEDSVISDLRQKSAPTAQTSAP
ncbi:hypothetical protein [Phyllobacterium chamaecytisi]|uniref:hypothetical protein n=1 Tax=Phyllobacterium chamaecytisi TaxID=2876082 RepID=UPI001CCCCFAB|nr:hypothetical protein [Phyllobacterium sp. KW56]MBZ9604012.1 hypothetical protein [Phyllobacterium sp. KW56]